MSHGARPPGAEQPEHQGAEDRRAETADAGHGPVGAQRLSFFLVGGDLDPIINSIAENRVRLAERRYPAFFRKMSERGREYVTNKEIVEAVRWLETLDQQ